MSSNTLSETPFFTPIPAQLAPLLSLLPVSLGPSSSPFAFIQPTQITGCTVWLDAADSSRITTSGSSVTAIVDKAQNINFATQGTSSFLTLVRQINGYQTLYFNNTSANNVYLRGTVNNLVTGSFFVVWQATTQQSTHYRPLFCPVYTGSSTFPVFGYVIDGANSVGPYTTFGGTGSPLTTVTVGTNYLTFYSWTGTTTNVGYNGATPSSGTQPAYSSSATQLDIMFESAANTTSGYIGEMIFYNSVLSTTNRQRIEGYLAWKWGLVASLPANHPFKNAPPGLQVPSVPLRLTMNSSQFQPNQFTTLSFWLDGADLSTMFQNSAATTPVTSTGQPVWVWRDKSSSALSVNFGNANIVLSNRGPYFAKNQGVTNLSLTVGSVFGVAAYASSTFESDFDGFLGGQYGGGNLMYGSATSNINSTLTNRTMYRNGNTNVITVTPNSNNIWAAVTPTPPSLTGLRVGYGDETPPAGAWFGTVSEIIVYTTSLNNSQRQAVEGYLAWKWNLVGNLPASHPYKRWPPPPS